MRTTPNQICDRRPRLPSCRDLVSFHVGADDRPEERSGSRRLYRRPVNLRQLLQLSDEARLGEGLTRDKELFQTPVFPARHRRGWMRGGKGRKGAPNKTRAALFSLMSLPPPLIIIFRAGGRGSKQGDSHSTSAAGQMAARWESTASRTHMHGIN